MAVIKPFKGIRPPKTMVEEVASRPYDVLNSEEAREEAKGNEKSLYHIIKPEIDFPVGTDEHDPAVYDKAVENFRMFQEKGWLVQDDKENYYVYAQTMNGKTQYGLVVGAYVPDYMNGVIKKHELTRRDKEEDRMKHVRVNLSLCSLRIRIMPNLMPLSLNTLHASRNMILWLLVTASAIHSGLLTEKRILTELPLCLPICRLCILPMVITEVLPLHWSVPRKLP